MKHAAVRGGFYTLCGMPWKRTEDRLTFLRSRFSPPLTLTELKDAQEFVDCGPCAYILYEMLEDQVENGHV